MFSSRFTWNTETNLLTSIYRQKIADNENILDLTVSNPTKAGFIYNENKILRAISNPLSMQYNPDPKGLMTARKAVANYYKDVGIEVHPDSIFLTASTSEAYSYLFKLLTDPQQNILVQMPGYPLLDFLSGLELIDIIPYYSIYNKIKGWEIDIDLLRARITDATAAITMVNPNNPTGAYIKEHEISALNNICIEKNIPMIVDEVFLDYTNPQRGGVDFRSLAGNKDSLTFVLSGLSKIAALPQVKLGWIVVSGPEQQCSTAKERLEFISDTYLSVGTAVQYAAEPILSSRNDIQHQIQKRSYENERYLESRIAQIPECRKLIREGGWYAVIEINNGFSDEQAALDLLKNDNVLVHPGYFFGFDNDNFLIISLLTPKNIFEQGIDKIALRIC